jgi:hypothetical protein
MWSRRRKSETGPAAPAASGPDATGPEGRAPGLPADAIAGRGPVPAAAQPGDDPLLALDLDHIRLVLDELVEAHGAADPATPPAPDATAGSGAVAGRGPDVPGATAGDGASPSRGGLRSRLSGGGDGHDARGRRDRRRVSGVALAVAAALAGSITTSRTGMLDGSGRAEEAADTSELGGTLPFQEDDLAEMEVELAAFEDPELLDDVPVSEGEVSDEVEEVLESAEVIETLGESGIPEVAIEAYMDGADLQADADPGCGIRWTLLAAIGRVESNHGRFGGAQLREDGYGTKPIRGIPLDGRPNVALIRDTDGGELDGDTTYDRAVGPMQFIPSTWRSVGQDGNDDGRSDPNNIFDAAQGAGAYLCAGDANLDDTAARARAVRRYNNADEYVRVVLSLAMMYETGEVEPLPDLPATPPPAATPSAPRPPAPTPAVPAPPAGPARPGQPGPTTPPATTPPRPRPPVTTEPGRGPVPTLPGPAPTTPPTTEPPVAPPPTTVPEGPAPTTLPPAPAEPPAAVGWAPAMREVVVDILSPDECAGEETAGAGGQDGVATGEPGDPVSAGEAAPAVEGACEPPGSDAAAAAPPPESGG